MPEVLESPAPWLSPFSEACCYILYSVDAPSLLLSPPWGFPSLSAICCEFFSWFMPIPMHAY